MGCTESRPGERECAALTDTIEQTMGKGDSLEKYRLTRDSSRYPRLFPEFANEKAG
jgi:hypothetical protein